MTGLQSAGSRRIAAFVGEDGRSHLLPDETAPRLAEYAAPKGMRTSILWATEPAARLRPGVMDPVPVLARIPPMPGGTLFETLTLPPDSVYADADFNAALAAAEMARHVPGMVELMEPEAPGFHRTETVDYVIVLSGEVWIVVDDGEARLRAGDTLVQLGSRHAWQNRSRKAAVLGVVLVGIHIEK